MVCLVFRYGVRARCCASLVCGERALGVVGAALAFGVLGVVRIVVMMVMVVVVG